MVSEKNINKFRMYFYIITALVILALALFFAFKNCEESKELTMLNIVFNQELPDTFYPPDICPHIHVPQPDNHQCPSYPNCPMPSEECMNKDVV